VTDDIVTRLQSGKHSEDPCPKCGDDTFCCTYELCDCCCAALEATAEAADEIQRLRHRVDRLNAALDDVAAVTADKGILHRIKEARRGEPLA